MKKRRLPGKVGIVFMSGVSGVLGTLWGVLCSCAAWKSLPLRGLQLPLFMMCAVFLCFSAACGRHEPPREALPAAQAPSIADLRRMPQSAGAYISEPSPRPFMTSERLAAYAENFVREYFSPWDRQSPKHALETIHWPFKEWREGSVYAENTLPIAQARLDALLRTADFENYPSMSMHGISVCETSMRAVPSEGPVFFDFDRAGEGFPFDYNQNSLLHAQTPVFVSHATKDGQWLHVESRFTFGWVPRRHIAFMADDDIRAFRSAPLAAFVKDDVPVTGPYGKHRFTGRIGALAPVVGGSTEEKQSLDILLVDRDETGQAVLLSAEVSARDAAPQPLPADAESLAQLLDEMMGQAYGWGGLYGNRDCSALLMDLFAPLGIALPRNSKRQAAFGRFISLKGLGPEAKEQLIRENGKPFATFLWHPGHIMLYLGQYEGRAAVAHAVWGVKTKRKGIEGRHVIGKTVITSLEPGKELPDISLPGGSRLLSLEGMTFLD
jgi:cell wall-associated NlpC family hydrolase